jgi:HAD superfamily hydrolase (TIGR01662 family)
VNTNPDQTRPLSSVDDLVRVVPTVNPRARRRIYLSSTYQDLVEFRRKADLTLRQLNYDVVGMENYVAADERPVDRCLADVRASDVYLGIFAWRYGFIPPRYDRSITELEYMAAGAAGLERLIFLSRDDAPWPRDQIERGPGEQQVERLRGDLKLGHMVALFSNPDDLATQVATAITAAAQRRLDADVAQLRADRTRVDQAQSRPEQYVVNAPPANISRFIDRQSQRTSLLDFLTNDSIRLVSVVGRAGIGKSALVTWVLTNMEEERNTSLWIHQPPTPDGILYLSSRSTGLTLERIYTDLRRMLPAEKADSLAAAWASQDATLPQKVETLLEALHGRRYVILLDAIEPLLTDNGALSDEGIQVFVDACLRRAAAPVLVLTSRADFLAPPEALRTARAVRLAEGLGPEDAAALLRDLDPQGDLGLLEAPQGELERVADLTGGIPRALEVVAGILQRDPTSSLRRLLDDERALGSETTEGLVAEGYRRLGESERRVMQALAVLEGSVGSTALSYLLHPWFPGVDVPGCLQRLVRSYLVTSNRKTGEFGLQPLDRDHAYAELPDAADPARAAVHGYSRQDLHRRAADFYASIRKPPVQWLSIDDLAPQLAEFQHSVRGDDVDRALDVLQSIDDDHLSLWGHYSRLRELRASVLEAPARPELRAANLAGLAVCCQVFGEYETAVRYYEQAIALAEQIGDRAAEAKYVGDLGRAYRNLGEIDKAVSCSQRALDFARERGDRRAVAVYSDKLALAVGQLGRLGEAAELGESAVTIAREVGDRRTEAAALSNLALIHQARGDAGLAELTITASLTTIREIRDGRGETIVLGRMGVGALAASDPTAAFELHEQALSVAVALGERREQSYQLIGLGNALNALGELEQAQQRLQSALVLDVPETSYLAALALGLVLLRSDRHTEAAEAFNDAVRRCRERLKRCDRLYRARYCLATALVGAVVCKAEWDDFPSRPALLVAAVTEFRRALNNCAGRGVVDATMRDVSQLAKAGITGLEPIIEVLERSVAPHAEVAGPGAASHATSTSVRPKQLKAVLIDFGETLVERVDDTIQPLNELQIIPFPDSAPALEQLSRAGYRLAVVSNTTQSDEQVMRGVLQAAGLGQYFQTVLTSFATGYAKPDPRIFRLALDRLDCSPAEGVMIGDDAIKDIGGAAAAGLRTVLISRGAAPADDSHPAATFTVRSLLEIPALLETLTD